MIAVAQDAEGLRRAYVELLEESMDTPDRERNERYAEMAANPEALLDSTPERRTLSPGYYGWIQYLQEAIEGPLECGVAIPENQLTAEEIEGLAAIRAGRAEFRQKHPPCRGCGKPLADASFKRCGDCDRAAFEAEARSGR